MTSRSRLHDCGVVGQNHGTGIAWRDHETTRMQPMPVRHREFPQATWLSAQRGAAGLAGDFQQRLVRLQGRATPRDRQRPVLQRIYRRHLVSMSVSPMDALRTQMPGRANEPRTCPSAEHARASQAVLCGPRRVPVAPVCPEVETALRGNRALSRRLGEGDEGVIAEEQRDREADNSDAWDS